MEWMIMPLKRYADFTGRARRKEFWMYQLLVLCLYAVVFLVAGLVGALTSGPNGESPAAAGIIGLFFLVVMFGLLIPSLAVSVRRLHDIDKSGWFLLINFLPFGGIVLLVFWCQEGTRGENRYGPDPKGNVSDVFS